MDPPVVVLERRGYRITRVWIGDHEITGIVRRIQIIHDASEGATAWLEIVGLTVIDDLPIDGEDDA